jgi:hypothetical protein
MTFYELVKFQKRSELKLVSRIIPRAKRVGINDAFLLFRNAVNRNSAFYKSFTSL